MRYVIGLDAGGTKTVGLLADEDGLRLAKTVSSGANLVVHGELAVEKVLYQVLAGLEPPEPVSALCLGIAGVDRKGEQDTMMALLRRLGFRERVQVVNDATVALVAGAPEGVGVVVVAGTGSIAYGIDPQGQTARSGGWGYLLGDEGSAYWLGHAAVRYGVRAADGRGPATSLFDRICQHLQVESKVQLVRWFYDQNLARNRVADLAFLVEEAARDDDAAASGLLDQAAQHLARAARAVVRQLEFSSAYPLVLSGGVFKACPSLRRRLEASLDLDLAEVRWLEIEPAEGAVTLARQTLP